MIKNLLYNCFFEIETKEFKIVNNFLAILTIISLLIIALATVKDFEKYHQIFTYIEYFILFFFTLEYITRIYITKEKLKYIFSFFGIIDLLAILPSFFGFTNFIFLKSFRTFRSFRMLRFLRMLRLAKMLKYTKNNLKKKKDYDEDEHIIFLTLEIYFVLFLTITFFSGTFMWFAEGYRDEFRNIPVSMIWSVKVLMGGVSQYHPETISGELISIFTRFVGVVLFALMINLIAKVSKKIFVGSK